MPDVRRQSSDRRRLPARAELIGLALFAGAALLALPFVMEASMLQEFWLTMCAAIGVPR